MLDTVQDVQTPEVDETSTRSTKETELSDPLATSSTSGGTGTTSSTGGGGDPPDEDNPFSTALGLAMEEGGPEKAEMEARHREMAQEVSRQLEAPLPTGSELSVYDQKRSLADTLAAAYTEQLQDPITMTIDIKEPVKGSDVDKLDYHIRIAPNDTDLSGGIPTDLPAWVKSAIRFNRGRHKFTLGFLKQLFKISGNKTLGFNALRSGQIGADFVYLAADAQRKLNKLPKAVFKTPIEVDGKLGDQTVQRFEAYQAWLKGTSVVDLIQMYVSGDTESVDSDTGEDVTALPPDIASAVAYNRKRHQATPALLKQLLKLSSDQRLYANALAAGEIGPDFVYLVKAAQREMNRLAVKSGQPELKIDGKLGPDTMKRYGGYTEERAVEEAQEDLGDVDNIDAFASVGGGLIDALVPRAGDKKKLVIAGNARISVGKLGLVFTAEAERDAQIKLGASLKFQFSAEVDAWVVDAFVKAGIYGYIQVEGDTGAEVMDIIFAAIERAVSAISEDAAEYVFGEGYSEEVRSKMDKDDYIEAGFGVEVNAGVRWGSDNGKKTSKAMPSGEYSGGVKAQTGWRMTSDDVVDTYQLELSRALTVGDWGGEFKAKMDWIDGKKSAEVSFAVNRSVDMLSFASQCESGAINEQLGFWIGSAVGTISSAIKGEGGLDAPVGGRTVGDILKTASGMSFNASENALIQAASAVKSAGRAAGMKLGQKLEVKIGIDSSSQKMSVELANISQFEIGEGDTDAFYLLMESANRIFKFEVDL